MQMLTSALQRERSLIGRLQAHADCHDAVIERSDRLNDGDAKHRGHTPLHSEAKTRRSQVCR